MKQETLEKANKLKKEIDKIERFLSSWEIGAGLRVLKKRKISLIPDSRYNDSVNRFEPTYELNLRIIDTILLYRNELKKEFENLQDEE